MTACSKRKGIQTVSVYSFTNTLNYPVTFDVYGSKEDYSNNANIISRHVMEAGSTVPISFDAPKTYWVDWYTADYSFNNWGPDTVTTGQGNSFNNPLPRPKLAIASEPDNISIRSLKRDTSLSVLLNGSGVSSTWQAVISDMPDLNGIHTFLFRKDFSGQYTFTRSTGAPAVQAFSYEVQDNQSSGYERSFILTTFDANKIPMVTFYFFVDAYSVSSSGRDTLKAYFNQSASSDYYWARRQ
jgi:hypothetical protein